jgi:hypothetical protein
VRPSDVGGCEYPEWAWWSGGTFVHKVGIESEIFGVSGCGTPRFLVWVVGGGEECLKHWAESCPGVNGERNEYHVFTIEFPDELLPMNERCIGCGGLVHTFKFTMFMALKVFVCIGSDVLRMMASASGW